MTPFDVYKTYVALKNHFSKPSYDYIKYAGKTRASIESFNKRKDKYWYEKLSRQKSDDEIKDFFIANFIEVDDPSRLWIGELSRTGESVYKDWIKRQQSLSYIFKEQSEQLFVEFDLNDLFDCSKTHPPILKKYLSKKINSETLVIFNKIFLFSDQFDNKLLDPVWESVSLKIKKYSPFLNIDIKSYKKVLTSIIGRKSDGIL
jgi:hypothetical protein